MLVRKAKCNLTWATSGGEEILENTESSSTDLKTSEGALVIDEEHVLDDKGCVLRIHASIRGLFTRLARPVDYARELPFFDSYGGQSIIIENEDEQTPNQPHTEPSGAAASRDPPLVADKNDSAVPGSPPLETSNESRLEVNVEADKRAIGIESFSVEGAGLWNSSEVNLDGKIASEIVVVESSFPLSSTSTMILVRLKRAMR